MPTPFSKDRSAMLYLFQTLEEIEKRIKSPELGDEFQELELNRSKVRSKIVDLASEHLGLWHKLYGDDFEMEFVSAQFMQDYLRANNDSTHWYGAPLVNLHRMHIAVFLTGVDEFFTDKYYRLENDDGKKRLFAIVAKAIGQMKGIKDGGHGLAQDLSPPDVVMRDDQVNCPKKRHKLTEK